jgi:hypothetical protein
LRQDEKHRGDSDLQQQDGQSVLAYRLHWDVIVEPRPYVPGRMPVGRVAVLGVPIDVVS